MIALAHSLIACGERFQFGAAHSEDSLGRFTFAGESRFNCRNGRGAEAGSGFGDCIHGMGWDGIYFAEGMGRNSKQGPETEAET